VDSQPMVEIGFEAVECQRDVIGFVLESSEVRWNSETRSGCLCWKTNWDSGFHELDCCHRSHSKSLLWNEQFMRVAKGEWGTEPLS